MAAFSCHDFRSSLRSGSVSGHFTPDYNTVLWEAVALALARRAGIPVPDARLESVDDKPVLVLRRFDRRDGQRIPFLSSMSMLDARDIQTRSYMEMADALRQHGAAAEHDIRELWP